MLVVADTGPLISLIHIDRLDILLQLYPDFVIAETVYSELKAYKKLSGHKEALEAVGEHVKRVNSPLGSSLLLLGIGEAESIALTKELEADAFLTDDMEAPRTAELMGIHCFGTLALLLQAKSRGLITAVKPLLQELISHRRFYSKEVIQLILVHAGE